jgi:UDPglucose 6-dehydrogenase
MSTPQPNIITILGAGYVGLTTAALLAHAGYTVYIVEPDTQRLKVIKQGRSFFFEAGLDNLIASALDKKTLIPTDSYADCVPRSHIVFSCVGTPDNPDGSSNLAFVFAAAKEAATHMSAHSIYVQKSTVPVGTGQRIEALFAQLNKTLEYVSNPEFLRESTALSDTLYFSRIVAGGRSTHSTEEILNVYRQLETFRADIVAHHTDIAVGQTDGTYIATSLNSAELIKVTSNAFLALKISFANSIAKLSDQVGADIVEVMNAVGADPRIGPAFLQAGRGYGGGCFPKDVSGLIASGLEHGVDLEILHAAQTLNSSMPGYIIEKLQIASGGSLIGKKIAVLGLSFKTGTSDVRRSPGIALAKVLHEAGAIVTIYDPQASHEEVKEFDKDSMRCDSIEQTVAEVDAVIIATGWPEILHFDLAMYAKTMRGTIFVDAINYFSPQEVTRAHLRYIGVGR